MGHSPCIFKQADVTGAIKGAQAAGMPISRVEIEHSGNIILVPQMVEEDVPNGKNPWDGVLDASDKKRPS